LAEAILSLGFVELGRFRRWPDSGWFFFDPFHLSIEALVEP
jgi:hypothetical protein